MSQNIRKMILARNLGVDLSSIYAVGMRAKLRKKFHALGLSSKTPKFRLLFEL